MEAKTIRVAAAVIWFENRRSSLPSLEPAYLSYLVGEDMRSPLTEIAMYTNQIHVQERDYTVFTVNVADKIYDARSRPRLCTCCAVVRMPKSVRSMPICS